MGSRSVPGHSLALFPLGALGALCTLASPPAAAQGPAQEQREAQAPVQSQVQSYEEAWIERALQTTGLVREPSPEGKLLERVEILRGDVISETDPWPPVLNLVHATTRDEVVRQELLLAPGESWDQDRVDETARNLRRLSILSVVRTVACRGSAPDRVVLLIVTKDLWSLRVNTVFTLVGSNLQSLDIQPTEQNLFGTGDSAGLHLRLQQFDLGSFTLRDKAALGQSASLPRLFGTRLALSEAFDLLLAGALPCGGRTASGGQWCSGHRQGQLEGFAGGVDLQRPLFSLATAWAFDLSAAANVREVRRYTSVAGGAVGLDTTTFDAALPAAQRVYLPQVYDVALYSTQATMTRSVGTALKHDFSLAVGAARSRYSVPEGFVEAFGDAAVAQYRNRLLPRSEATNYLLVGYRTRDTRYIGLQDIQTFALTEDYQLGHDVSLVARAANALGLARQGFADATLRAQLRFYFSDDLLTLALAAETRYQPHLDELGRDGPWANNALEVSIRNASPRFFSGRLHAYAHLLVRSNDLSQSFSALGSDSGLRGFPANAFTGHNLMQLNAEFRSEPINFNSLHLGLVAFYDGGAVFGGPDPRNPTQPLAFAWRQSLGVGARLQFPQFNKAPLRADLGIPLGGGLGAGSWFSLSFGQAF